LTTVHLKQRRETFSGDRTFVLRISTTIFAFKQTCIANHG